MSTADANPAPWMRRQTIIMIMLGASLVVMGVFLGPTVVDKVQDAFWHT